MLLGFRYYHFIEPPTNQMNCFQMELQEVEPHTGITTTTAQDACRLLKTMVGASWNGTHSCSDRSECMFCESCVMWYQLALQLVKFLAPQNPAHPPDVSKIINYALK